MRAVLGALLKHVHAGDEKLAFYAQETAAADESLEVASSGFAYGTAMPARYTQDGENNSPPLRWRLAPEFGEDEEDVSDAAAIREEARRIAENAQSAVLIVEDPDAPLPFPFVHCIAYNLPPDGVLAEGALSAGAAKDGEYSLGRGTFGDEHYRGPRPVANHGPHRYYFQFFVLDCSLQFPSPPKRKQVLTAMKGHVVTKGILVGTFERKTVRA